MQRQSQIKQRVVLSWSSGKDSAWTLYRLQQQDVYEVIGLITTFNEAFQRSAMHGVRRDLVQMQARAAKLPLHEVPLPWPCSNEVYEQAMLDACQTLHVDWDVSLMAFGDLFLEDVREYREKFLEKTDFKPMFPLWNEPTDSLAGEMIDAGLRARITCMDPKKLNREFAGHDFNRAFLGALPADVDPCGEYGEFHTFTWNGPMFEQAIQIQSGETVEREGFVFTDILPGEHTS
jgi:uncharacterized protein (TIGR00290 family)